MITPPLPSSLFAELRFNGMLKGVSEAPNVKNIDVWGLNTFNFQLHKRKPN